MKEIWIVGTANGNNIVIHSMFEHEGDAIKNSIPGNFIALINVNGMLPTSIIDSNKIYWPHAEIWETSDICKLQDFIMDQEPLDEEFEKILFENLWDLYQE